MASDFSNYGPEAMSVYSLVQGSERTRAHHPDSCSASFNGEHLFVLAFYYQQGKSMEIVLSFIFFFASMLVMERV